MKVLTTVFTYRSHVGCIVFCLRLKLYNRMLYVRLSVTVNTYMSLIDLVES